MGLFDDIAGAFSDAAAAVAAPLEDLLPDGWDTGLKKFVPGALSAAADAIMGGAVSRPTLPSPARGGLTMRDIINRRVYTGRAAPVRVAARPQRVVVRINGRSVAVTQAQYRQLVANRARRSRKAGGGSSSGILGFAKQLGSIGSVLGDLGVSGSAAGGAAAAIGAVAIPLAAAGAIIAPLVFGKSEAQLLAEANMAGRAALDEAGRAGTLTSTGDVPVFRKYQRAVNG